MILNKVERPRYVEGHGFGYATSLLVMELDSITISIWQGFLPFFESYGAVSFMGDPDDPDDERYKRFLWLRPDYILQGGATADPRVVSLMFSYLEKADLS